MIEVRNLTKRYGNKAAVDNISFKVKEGEILGFLGPNGAGKSTTMNILTGYLSATSGDAVIDGINILEDPANAKRRIGFLPEQPPLYMDMTVKEYLNFVYELKECKLPRKAHLQEVCQLVKISDVYERIIKNLSKGYKQRVGLAQALIGNPPVLILDEPTVGLDPKQIIEIRNLISSLGKHHTIILSSHILPEIQAVCNKVIVINRGVIIANDTPDNLSSSLTGEHKLLCRIAGKHQDVLRCLKSIEGMKAVEFLGYKEEDAAEYILESLPSVDIRKPLFNALCEKHYPLLGLSSMDMSLEDIFIQLVAGKEIAPLIAPEQEQEEAAAEETPETSVEAEDVPAEETEGDAK